MAVEMLRRGGRLMEFSVFAENVSFDWSVISDIKELEIIGAHLAFHTYPIAIDLLSRGLITSRGIVTHTFPLRDFKEAIDTARERREGAIKVLMKP
jgi:L-iditol 2-dehydrogenase